ncbi:MAG: hypothetical protein WC758_03240 [Candidatus Woesearchaeota archaeon]|jgi:hypothetical protein
MKIYPNYEARLIPILKEKNMFNEETDILEDYFIQVNDYEYA